jgi:hypothetical protein
MGIRQWMSDRATRRAATPESRRSAFRDWYRRRPFIGGVLTVIAGVEMFFSGQLDVGKIHIQVGIEGLQAMIIPIVLVLLGVLAVLMPMHRIFYGVIALVLSVYSLIGVNLGGFFIGMLLGAIGGVLIVAWAPKTGETAAHDDRPQAADARLDESPAEPPPFAQRRH